MSKHEEVPSNAATSETTLQHKMTKKERERQDELAREAKAKANGKDHHKKHGNN